MKEFKIDWPSRGHSYNLDEVTELSQFLLEDNSTLSQGKHVSKFEAMFEENYHDKSAIALMSAAHALDLIAIKVKSATSKRTILCPTHTYCASVLGFLRVGFKVVFVDIDPKDWTVSFDSVKTHDPSDVAAIVVVHLYGKPAKSSKQIRDYCDEKGCFMVEDCAQAFGAKYYDLSVGQLGDFACFSFHSQKNITTLGEGGMLVTNRAFEQEFRELRINGHRPFARELDEPYWLPAMVNTVETLPGVIPMKSTLSEAQALIGTKILARYKELSDHRFLLIKEFIEALGKCDAIELQEGILLDSHARHLLPMRIKGVSRDVVIQKLVKNYSIKAIIQYYPLNRYDLFSANPNVSSLDLTNTDDFFDSMISVPFSATMSREEMIYIAQSLREILC
jgi:perosamine synthetase